MSRRIPEVAQALDLHPDYLAFAFVRDPCERFVSLWSDLRRVAALRRGPGPEPAGLATPEGFAELCGEILAEFGPVWGPDATATFRALRGRAFGPGGVRLGDLGWSADHLWPQAAFLPDCNQERLFGVARTDARPLDFVGRVETIDADFARLGRVLGLAPVPLPRRNASGTEGMAARLDAATRRKVEELYAADVAFVAGVAGDRRSPVRLAPARHPLRTLPARLRRWPWSLCARIGDRLLEVAAVRRLARRLAARRGPDGAVTAWLRR